MQVENYFMMLRQPGDALHGLVSRILGYQEKGRRLQGSIEAASLVVPLIISFGDPYAIALGRAPGKGDNYASFTAGLYPGHVVIESTGSAASIQIDFTPLGAYRFFAKHLGLSLAAVARPDGTVDESKNVIEKPEQMAAFTKDHPRQESALQGQAEVLKALHSAQGKPMVVRAINLRLMIEVSGKVSNPGAVIGTGNVAVVRGDTEFTYPIEFRSRSAIMLS